MSPVETLLRWSLFPIAAALTAVLGVRAGAVALPQSCPRERALFGGVAACAVIVAGVGVLGVLGVLSAGAILAWLVAATAGALAWRRERRIGLCWQGLVTMDTCALALVACGSLVVAVASAYLLPIWQWDSLGYHLPYVNFVLQGKAFAAVPQEMPYLATYPHVVESFFVAWRAMLPNDRLVDAAQIPFGLLGALAVAVIARQAGAARNHAVGAGLLWLTVPAVFLQLPTNYVDIASASLLLAAAAFALSEPKPAHVVGAGIALGLFLGSKPNAPIATVLLFGVLSVRAWRAGRRRSLLAGAALTLLLGGESYIINTLQHGNPSWPVALKLGPIRLPGEVTVDTLLASGCGAPRVSGSLPLQLLRSWTALDAPPMFDMRYGGFGLPFLLALPVAIAHIVRRRSLPLALVLAATLASPDPVVARYVFAFPGIVLALASSAVSVLSSRMRTPLLAFLALAAAVQLVRVYPALAGDGPSLTSYWTMNEADRLRAVGADGSPAPFHDALERLAPGKTTAFDSSLDLPYLAWPYDLSRYAMHIPDHASRDDAARLLANRDVGMLIVGDGSPVAKAAREADPPFAEVFRCRRNVPACATEAITRSEGGDKDRMLDILNLRWPSCIVLLRGGDR